MPRAISYENVPLSIAHLCELDTAPAKLIEIAGKAGFASVGLRIAPAAAGGIEYPLRASHERNEVRQRMAATGVSVLYVELVSLSGTTRAEDHKALLETGAALGATRLCVAGDSADLALVADRLAKVCELAYQYGIEVDLEFMPFRAVRTFEDAAEVVRLAAQPNAHVLIDTLHVWRSGSSLDRLRIFDPAKIGTLQICDAPLVAPPDAELVTEARTHRLIPGQGGLALWPIIDTLPADIPIGVEVPLANLFPDLAPVERLSRLARETRKFLNKRHAS